MPKQPFRRLMEAAIDDPTEKKAVGPVRDVKKLLDTSTLSALDRRFSGCYAIFIHDRNVDGVVSDYVNGTALSSDTGANVLALFIPRGAGPVGDPPPSEATALVEFARNLFPREHIRVPGIVVVARLASECDPIYVPLGDLRGLDEVAARARQVLACAADAVKGDPDPQRFAITLGKALAMSSITYSRADGKSVAELLIVALRALWDAKSDIMSLVKLGTKLASA